jgi:putative tricarboxylic transport membrane protein
MDAVKAGNRVVSGGSRGDDQTTFGLLLAEMGWTEAQAPYIISSSSNDAITSILGNHIDIVISKPAAASPYVEAGQLIPILALSNVRFTGDLASAPTVSEVGPFKNVEFPVWRGIVGPAAMSPEAQAFWSAAFKKVTETGVWKNDYIAKFKLIPEYMTYQQSAEYMAKFEKEYLASQGK